MKACGRVTEFVTNAIIAIIIAITYPLKTNAFEYEVTNYRGGDAVTLTHISYDYVPTVMKDGNYRMWWCGYVRYSDAERGDAIYYSEAATMTGPWSTPRLVFEPRFDADVFDSKFTCDPSVVRVNGVYYMYYGAGVLYGQIGVASSPDGITWTRLNGGQPIITTARPISEASEYGAGQPSVLFLDGYFYITYTDTTGYAGPGQYVLRSTDPTFQASVEELTQSGFQPRTAANHTRHRFMHAFSVDWQFSDELQGFVFALAGSPGNLVVRIFDKTLTSQLTAGIYVPGEWSEGFGVASRPDKHAIPTAGCGVLPVDVMRSVGDVDTGSGSDLSYLGFDIVTDIACASAHMPEALEGYILTPPGLPQALVIGSQRLQYQVPAIAQNFSRNRIGVSSDIFHLLPSAGSLYAGQTVLQAPGRPGAFLIGSKLWPVSCLKAVTDNGSSITTVTTAVWDSYARGPSLKCLAPIPN